MAVRTNNPDASAATLQSATKAAQEVNLAEISALASLFRETSQSQRELLDSTNKQIAQTLEALKTMTSTMQDLLQVLTQQSEMAEKQSIRLVTVTTALTRATTALRALPPGSAIRPGTSGSEDYEP